MAFKEGESGNPGGRPKLPDDIKEARQMSLEEFLRYIISVMKLTPSEVKEINMDDMPLGKRAILNAFAKNDYKAMKDFQDRLWGKAKESIDLTHSGELNPVNITVKGVATIDNDN